MRAIKVCIRSVLGQLKRLSLMRSRYQFAKSYFTPRLRSLRRWVFCNREVTNFTYDLTDLNKQQLAYFCAHITGCSLQEIEGYIDEIASDQVLRQFVLKQYALSHFWYSAESYCEFGRRIGWYALIRATKPALVVETGVDKGLGSVVIAVALLKNKAEGRPGEYVGIDINPHAGYLFQKPYTEVGKIVYADAIDTLNHMTGPIDFFISDSDHCVQYEYNEYKAIDSKLSSQALIVADNAHCSDSLMRYARDVNKAFLFFSESPKDHWYPGGGIGVAFSQQQSP